MNFNHNFNFAILFLFFSGIAFGEVNQVHKHPQVIATTAETPKSVPEQVNVKTFESTNIVCSHDQEEKEDSESMVLPNEFKAKSNGKTGWLGTHKFQIDSKAEGAGSSSDILNGKFLKQKFWALRTIFSLTDSSLSTSLALAYKSWFHLRTFNVFDEDNNYLGQINKHWFTWFSGVHRYDIRDKEGKILAVAHKEGAGGAFAEIVMRSADKNYRYDQVVAKFRVPREYNPYLDDNNDYLAWNVKIDDKDQKFFSKQHLDPRILTMFIPFVSRKDYAWK